MCQFARHWFIPNVVIIIVALPCLMRGIIYCWEDRFTTLLSTSVLTFTSIFMPANLAKGRLATWRDENEQLPSVPPERPQRAWNSGLLTQVSDTSKLPKLRPGFAACKPERRKATSWHIRKFVDLLLGFLRPPSGWYHRGVKAQQGFPQLPWLLLRPAEEMSSVPQIKMNGFSYQLRLTPCSMKERIYPYHSPLCLAKQKYDKALRAGNDGRVRGILWAHLPSHADRHLHWHKGKSTFFTLLFGSGCQFGLLSPAVMLTNTWLTALGR